jgi:exopolysaccharide biosynthesis predicted pyruvyltransferase EpsI
MSLLLQNGYNVVGMPQSLYFKNKDLSNADALTLKDEISRGLNLSESVLDSPEGIRLAKERVTLTWREIVSYEEAKVLYPFVNNMLVPDIALRLGPFKPMRPRKFAKDTVDILIFLRKDIESKVAHVRDNHGWIQNALPNLPNNNTTKPTYRVVDWTDRKDIFQDDNILFTETSIQLISLGKVVVADRLHASILAYLTGVPFVYIDQVSGKVTKTLDGAFSDIPGCLDGEKAKWAKAGTLKEALSMATSFLPSE